MTEIIKFFFFGILLHQTKHLTKRGPEGWSNLAEHTIGAIGIWAAARWLLKRLGAGKLELSRFDQAMAYAELGIGAGVSFGWVIDTILRR